MSTDTARAVEAILMVAQEPVDPHLLAQLLEVAPAVVEATVTELQRGYEEQGRGFELVKVAGGYRFQSAGDLAAYVERFALEGQSARLSNAALETLAIVAYKQPLSRAQVAAIRGVNVDGVMRTLQQRGYIEEVGRDHGPGQATLFGTSREFLERMGLDTLDDLPPIAELFPAAEVLEALEQTLRAERPPAPDPAGAPADPSAPDVGPLVQHAEPADLAAEVTEAETTEAETTEGEVAGAEHASEPTAGAGHGPQASGPVVISLDDEDDDRPAPEPPAWAVASAPVGLGEAEEQATASAPADPVDLEADGTPDLPVEP
jgi:segregation and condensation protein B